MPDRHATSWSDPVWYAASIQAHIDEEIRLADRIEALTERGNALVAASEAYLDAEGFTDKEAYLLEDAIDAWKGLGCMS